MDLQSKALLIHSTTAQNRVSTQSLLRIQPLLYTSPKRGEPSQTHHWIGEDQSADGTDSQFVPFLHKNAKSVGNKSLIEKILPQKQVSGEGIQMPPKTSPSLETPSLVHTCAEHFGCDACAVMPVL